MGAAFDFTIDRARKLICVRLAGFFTREDVRRYQAAFFEATVRLGGEARDQRVLGDIRDLQIQSQDIVQSFAEVLADPRNRERRTALVVAPSLARSQAMRAIEVAGRDIQPFFEPAEAEAWLLAPIRQAA